jgi:acyl dehydratase
MAKGIPLQMGLPLVEIKQGATSTIWSGAFTQEEIDQATTLFPDHNPLHSKERGYVHLALLFGRAMGALVEWLKQSEWMNAGQSPAITDTQMTPMMPVSAGANIRMEAVVTRLRHDAAGNPQASFRINVVRGGGRQVAQIWVKGTLPRRKQ